MKPEQELQILAQESIDELGWYGTLKEILESLPEDSNLSKQIVEMMVIAAPRPSVEETIAKHGLQNFIFALRDVAEATAGSKVCSPELKAKIEQIIRI